MTDADVAMLSKTFTAVMRDLLREAMTPLERRVETVEGTTTAAIADTRERFLRELGEVRERVAVVETREPIAGPPGPAGAPGADGKDGTPGLRYCGVWVEGKAYDPGDCATWAGSMWHCNEATSSRPGDASKLWTLMVKAGRDVGRDTRDRGTAWRSYPSPMPKRTRTSPIPGRMPISNCSSIK